MQIDSKKLQGFRIFENLRDEEYLELASLFEQANIEANENFIKVNEFSHWIYLVLEGSVSVEVHSADSSGIETLAKLGAGEVVGEFVLVKNARRSANARSLTAVKAYRCESSKLLALFEESPRIGLVVFRNLAELLVDRIRDTNMLARNALASISRIL